ncbi:MAG: class I SAM-dependent methyltransferase [Candidatus Omnitrophica bacterium]|nr:class I SAM-dependent methyltransferase [Candidatus Omnitrophota bacterium]
MKNTKCPVCENPENRLLYSKEEDLAAEKFSFNILRCGNCSHLFSFPLSSSGELNSNYEETRAIFLDDLKKTNKKIKKWDKGWRKFILKEYLGYKKTPSRNSLKYLCAFFMSRFTSLTLVPFHGEGKILDVGCYNMLYLHLLKNLGWDVQGVEIDRNACRLAMELDISTFCGELENAGFAEESFDVVRFNQVLEHIPDPKKTINEAKRVLKKGGRLYISVPNARSLARLLFGDIWLGPAGHVQGFSPRSATYLCRHLGFKIKSMRFNSSRNILINGIDYFLKGMGKDISLKNRFTRYAIASPLNFILNILHLSDTLTVEAEK